MKINSSILISLAVFTALLIGVTVVVYHHSYQEYHDRVVESSESWGKHVRAMVRRNIVSLKEDMALFGQVASSELTFSGAEKGVGVNDALLARRFVAFFENEYGLRVYESVYLTNESGEVVASSDGSRGDHSTDSWWQEAMTTGEAYRFVGEATGQPLLLIARRLPDASAHTGVLVGLCPLSSLIKDIGFTLNNYGATKLDILAEDGTLLYSTSLHQAFKQYDFSPYETRGDQNSLWLVREENGAESIALVLFSPPKVDASLGWILVLTFDSEELFRPIIALRWWIVSGITALVLLGVLLLVLIRRVKIKQIEKRQLLKQQKMLESILNGIQAGVIFIDRETLTITRASEHAGTLLGRSHETLIGEKCFEHICRFGKEMPQQGCPARDKKILHAEFELEREDGTVIPVTKTVLEMTLNNRPHLVSVLFDITDRKQIETQLAHALKLESIGSLAAGIAHEINTPAQYITDNLKFIKQAYQVCAAAIPRGTGGGAVDIARVEKDDLHFYATEVPKAISQSLDGVHHITTTVQALKKLSHPGGDLMEENDLNEIVRNVSIVCRNEWKYTADLVYDLDDSLPLVKCNSHDMSQVFLNLIINSSHAVRDKNEQSKGKGIISVKTYVEGNEAVVLVEDNGIGIPEDVQERVFDPFFTTKEVGQGSGQGLSICYSIINKHNGRIELASEPGVGTSIRVSLPMNWNERDE